MKLKDFDEEIIDLDEEKDGQTGDEPEDEPEEELLFKDMAPWQKLVIFCIMFVVAVAITTVLWKITPKGDWGNEKAEGNVTEESGSLPGNQEAGAGLGDLGSDGEMPATSVPDGEVVVGTTMEPAVAPTVAPTAVHTAVPTAVPTSAPTAVPTEAPTANPNRVSTIDGRVIVFENCDEWIMPKEMVNMRIEPSTTEGDATVWGKLYYGEKVHRTGISEDSGWSRIEYDGHVLYVVSNYMYLMVE